MAVLQNNDLSLDVFYKNENIPKIILGDKVKIFIYLELPEAVEDEKKKIKNVFKPSRVLLFRDTYHLKK